MSLSRLLIRSDGEQGRAVNIVQDMELRFVSAKYQIFPGWYAGLGYFGGDVATGLGIDASLPPGFPDPRLRVKLGAYELPLQFDTRDDTLFPREGWLFDAKAMLYRSSIGSDVSADVFTLEANHYRPTRTSDVLALRAYFRNAQGDVPFFLLSSFGGKSDLRGYESGRYRDEMMYAVQAEYRWRPNDRWVFTGFAGFGGVAAEFDALFDDLLSAGGIGARFMLSQEHKFSISVDFAVGEGDRQFYFGIGEAF